MINNSKPISSEQICKELRANLKNPQLEKQAPIYSQILDLTTPEGLNKEYNDNNFDIEFKRSFNTSGEHNNIFYMANQNSNDYDDFLNNSSSESNDDFDENGLFDLEM